MKIIKLTEDHYIVMDDSEIKEGDWIGFPNLKKFVPVQYFGGDLTGGEKKITHSTQPLEWFGGEIIFLSEVKELLGIVDVEKKAFDLYESLNKEYFSGGHKSQLPQTNRERQSICDGFIIGYNQALEDNKDKKYTEEDMKKMFVIGGGLSSFNDTDDNKFKYALTHIQPKTEWEVEFVNGKLKLKS